MKTIAECKAADPSVMTCETAGIEFAFTKPIPLVWRNYRAAAMSAKMPSGVAQVDGGGLLDSYEELAKKTVQSHSSSELDAIAIDYLDLFLELGQAIAKVLEKDMERFAQKKGTSKSAP